MEAGLTVFLGCLDEPPLWTLECNVVDDNMIVIFAGESTKLWTDRTRLLAVHLAASEM